MLEGAGSPRVQLAHTDGGDDGQVVGSEQVVLAQSDEVAEPVRLGGSLVQPGCMLEGARQPGMWLADSVSRSEEMVWPVKIVVQDANSDGKRVRGPFVKTVNALERAGRSWMKLAHTVVGGEVVADGADGGRAVGEAVARGEKPGLGASLANDVEKRPAAEAGGLNTKPGNSRPGRGEASRADEHVASDEAWVGQRADRETRSNLVVGNFYFYSSLFYSLLFCLTRILCMLMPLPTGVQSCSDERSVRNNLLYESSSTVARAGRSDPMHTGKVSLPNRRPLCQTSILPPFLVIFAALKV